MNSARYRGARVGGCLSAEVEQRPGGEVLLRSTEPLGDFPRRLSDRLEHWARTTPDRVLAAQRDPAVPGGGDWLHVTYGQMLERARAVGQALLERGADVERPLAILSGNDLEHLTLAMGAMWAGVPWVPISPAYSLLSSDHAKLRHIFDVTTPAVVYASDPSYASAIKSVAPSERADVHVVLGTGTLPDRTTTLLSDLLSATPGAALDAAHASTGPDTIVKFLFTSGSTKQPKGVVNTQRMWCANLQMQAQCMGFLADEPPVLVDWLPWNHTFGGNQNVGLVLYNGGTLYIDEGKPTPKGIAQTIRNLREIAPTVYFNVPKGFEELSLAMEHDEILRSSLFSRVKAFMFAGAGLSQSVWDRLDRQAEATVGERIRIITGLGMTETAPSCLFVVQPGAGSGHVGLPCPGVEVKLVPNAEGSGKTEIRFRGPNVMPGYWRAPELTADAFDSEGFYRTGDAVRWIDDRNPQRGLAFDGRIAEDFKLSTGTFVSVGALRARVIAEGDPLVQDVVVAGLNRDDIGLLVFPRVDELRARFGLPLSMSASDVLGQDGVRAFFQAMLDRLWAAGTGSANRPARAVLLADPPQIDHGELTDKGSINQRMVLARRSALVERMYEARHGGVLLPGRS
ncbi:feruloyl-CoA synthase [Variovorax terrae]|uniref:Feruloyl-CoA synthase n=1 Tax=Variovorax terrae TaxID=2923278 RepID=A0A9X1VVU3_9BURK|nr:feruloyl-CoA synthase [Variovorax terrae]MCJ0761603.1 feruloyl-CoA synthase [Variovorax terrae]